MPKSEHDQVKAHMVAYANAARLAEKAKKLLDAGKIRQARVEFKKAEKWMKKAEGMEGKSKGSP